MNVLKEAEKMYVDETNRKKMEGKETEIEIPKSFFPEALRKEGKEVHISFDGKVKIRDNRVLLILTSYNCSSYEKNLPMT